MELGALTIFFCTERVQQALHQHGIVRVGEVIMILPIEHSNFSDSLTNLLSCPKSLIIRAEEIVRGHKDVNWHFAYRLNGNEWRVTELFPFHVLGRVLLEAILYSVLEHVL